MKHIILLLLITNNISAITAEPINYGDLVKLESSGCQMTVEKSTVTARETGSSFKILSPTGLSGPIKGGDSVTLRTDAGYVTISESPWAGITFTLSNEPSILKIFGFNNNDQVVEHNIIAVKDRIVLQATTGKWVFNSSHLCRGKLYLPDTPGTNFNFWTISK